MDEICVGIDVSKDTLDVAFHPSGEASVYTRDDAGIAALVVRLKDLGPRLVALEATGGFETVVAGACAAAQLPVVVVNPAQVRHFARAVGAHAKTDPIDAAIIARFAQATRPAIRPMPDENTQQLADLTTRRRQILQMLTAEKQRHHRAAPPMRKSIARLVKALEKELKQIDRHIDTAIRGTPVWREKEDLLKGVPGVGRIVARTLLAELPELGALTRREIASLVGLAPYTRQSGKWRGKSFIHGGRAPVRTVIYMAALSASKHNPQLACFYQRLLVTGKPKKLALIAVARKLLTILNAIIRDNKQWENA